MTIFSTLLLILVIFLIISSIPVYLHNTQSQPTVNQETFRERFIIPDPTLLNSTTFNHVQFEILGQAVCLSLISKTDEVTLQSISDHKLHQTESDHGRLPHFIAIDANSMKRGVVSILYEIICSIVKMRQLSTKTMVKFNRRVYETMLYSR